MADHEAPSITAWRKNFDDPTFMREVACETVRIRTIDRIVNAIEDARMAMGLSKADLARAIGSNPASVRRLLTARANPTISSIADLAAVVGLEVVLQPMQEDPLSNFQKKHAPTPVDSITAE